MKFFKKNRNEIERTIKFKSLKAQVVTIEVSLTVLNKFVEKFFFYYSQRNIFVLGSPIIILLRGLYYQFVALAVSCFNESEAKQ